MVNRDLVNDIGVARGISPAVYTATTNGQSIDLRGFDSVAFTVATGTVTDGSYTVTLEESDDNTTFTAVPAADYLITSSVAIAATDDNVVRRFGYRGTKRYVRPVLTATGAVSGGAFSVTGALGHADKLPVEGFGK